MPETQSKNSTASHHDNLSSFDKWRRARILRALKELHANSLHRAGILEELESLGWKPGGDTDSK